MLALYGLGMVFASVFLLWGRQAFHLASLLQEPVYVLSGLSFPVKVLGSAVASVAAVLPLTAGVDALRQILFPPQPGQAEALQHGLMPVWVEALILAGLVVLFIGLARLLPGASGAAGARGRPVDREVALNMAHDSRTLRWSAWLGWQLDSNWATPWLFVLYVLVKPLAGSFMLVCMYWAARAATGGRVDPDYLPFLYISSACFMLIGGVTHGMSYAVVSDRESYGMLKFIRISPARLQTYLVGRGLSRAGQSAVGAVDDDRHRTAGLPRAAGGAAPRTGSPGAGCLLYALAGTGMVVALGPAAGGGGAEHFALRHVPERRRGGSALPVERGGISNRRVAGLAAASQPGAAARPTGSRACAGHCSRKSGRAELGDSLMGSPVSAWSQGHLALAVGSTLALSLAGHLFFRWSERRAWLLGKYDDTSGN